MEEEREGGGASISDHAPPHPLAVSGNNSLEDLYTLNFKPFHNGKSFVSYFLALFPVFVLSASLPIIAITLRNNLK